MGWMKLKAVYDYHEISANGNGPNLGSLSYFYFMYENICSILKCIIFISF